MDKCGDIECVMLWRIRREVLFCQFKQPHRRFQAPPMFRMRRMLEIFLEMNKGARGLDESFEKIVVIRVGVQPQLLEDIMRFVVTLLVPALKIGAVKWVARDFARRKIDIFSDELGHKLRNPLAFAHDVPNLIAAQTMGKPSIFPEDEPTRPRVRVNE
jgi:hypothetical protein